MVMVTKCMDGLKALANIGVVTGHTPFFAAYAMTGYRALAPAATESGPVGLLYRFLAWYMLMFAVDIFLMLSGFFLAHKLVGMLGPEKPRQPSLREIAATLAGRLLRLAPVYLMAMLLFATSSENCPNMLELTGMATQVLTPGEMCLGVGWSNQADFQSWVIVLVTVYLVFGISSGPNRWKHLERVLWLLIAGGGVVRAAEWACLLYTSDAADEEDSVDLGGRRIIKKKKRDK
eukprot:TRINITY_DN15170_c0_g1_i1.p1 TRINITY_DN15170_c0_g1~~TRINITY_DN15170_c0_g1_i1.p1  ORF type:complete len:233 (+),score=71.26 TRINITY_DN15170_c0_g1_i1:188-886(+)